MQNHYRKCDIYIYNYVERSIFRVKYTIIYSFRVDQTTKAIIEYRIACLFGYIIATDGVIRPADLNTHSHKSKLG